MLSPVLHKMYLQDDFATARYYVDTCIGQMLLIADSVKLEPREAIDEVFWSSLVIFEHTIFYSGVLNPYSDLCRNLPSKFISQLKDVLLLGAETERSQFEAFAKENNMQELTQKCIEFVGAVQGSWGAGYKNWNTTYAKLKKTAA